MNITLRIVSKQIPLIKEVEGFVHRVLSKEAFQAWAPEVRVCVMHERRHVTSKADVWITHFWDEAVHRMASVAVARQLPMDEEMLWKACSVSRVCASLAHPTLGTSLWVQLEWPTLHAVVSTRHFLRSLAVMQWNLFFLAFHSLATPTETLFTWTLVQGCLLLHPTGSLDVRVVIPTRGNLLELSTLHCLLLHHLLPPVETQQRLPLVGLPPLA